LEGWNGRILRVDLSRGKTEVQAYDAATALSFLGGRGLAAKILWEETNPRMNALSPECPLIFAAGPLTGLGFPSSGKLVVAAKSPLTGGYGDGNLGSLAAVHLRKAGFDAVVVSGAVKKPSYVLVMNEVVEVIDAEDLWGIGTFETERKLRERQGRNVGILSIGPAGENLVSYSTIVSQEGRSGGRPGMGAVMGSKKIKALVLKGDHEIPVADREEVKRLRAESFREILKKPNYAFWRRQGTMSTIEWSQQNSVLPTFNFKEGVFDYADEIGGATLEKQKISQRGCPDCNMICGNVIYDAEQSTSELDYENVAMLGSNIGLPDLKQVAVLNRIADDYGLDTISLGNVIGFAMEASERGLIKEKLEWGNFKAAKSIVEDIAYRRGLGELLSQGTKLAAERLGHDSWKWAMNIKGLEISAYECHSMPGMALAFGTSPIGAHHKDAWVISWEASFGREGYVPEKVDKVIEFQRIRGGMFESLGVCRFPWIELGFELDWYPRFLKASTGVSVSLIDLFKASDRIYSLIRAFWVRDYGSKWSRRMDTPPPRWFEEPLTMGRYKGSKLDMQKYDSLLDLYYKRRGWDARGIPSRATMENLGLGYVASELQTYVEQSPSV
jgi:aldehyde:ferredoxin oxidoreductase